MVTYRAEWSKSFFDEKIDYGYNTKSKTSWTEHAISKQPSGSSNFYSSASISLQLLLCVSE